MAQTPLSRPCWSFWAPLVAIFGVSLECSHVCIDAARFYQLQNNFLKMYDSGLETFIQKFNQLRRAGETPILDLDTHADVAQVGLRVQHGHTPGPVHCPFPPPRHSQERRRQER